MKPKAICLKGINLTRLRQKVFFAGVIIFLIAAISLLPLSYPILSIGVAPAEAAGPGVIGSSVVQRIITILVSSYPKFEKFIKAHVANLVQRGSSALERAIQTKSRTIAEHETRLSDYIKNAKTPRDWARIESFKREIERLKTELRILQDALKLLQELRR